MATSKVVLKPVLIAPRSQEAPYCVQMNYPDLAGWHDVARHCEAAAADQHCRKLLRLMPGRFRATYAPRPHQDPLEL